MPQLNPYDWAPQVVWLIIIFGILYVLMAWIALPRIGTVLENRRGKIAADLKAAEDLRQATEEAIAAYEQALAEAKQKAQAIAQETHDALAAEVAAEREKLEHALAEKAAEAEARIGEAKRRALKEVDSIAADVAGEIVNRLIGLSPAKAETAKAVAAARQA
jgi:F-type H+-transporting ATPase subunit b